MKPIVWIFVLGVAAHAQVSGTIIVFDLTPDGFFVAADSRSTFQNAPPEDFHCKLAAINQNTVFAVAASAAYPADASDLMRPWDAIREARNAADSAAPAAYGEGHDVVTSIADEWAKSMRLKWESLQLFHPDKLRGAEQRGKGILTRGIFASAKDGSVSLTMRVIESNNGTITSDTPPIPCTLCATGELDIFNEFAARVTARSKSSDGDLPTAPMLKVIRLVDLTIAYDVTGNVGGRIDALSLSPDGHITWFQKKNDCPENHR